MASFLPELSPYSAILATGLLAYVPHAVKLPLVVKASGGTLDNRNPRAAAERATRDKDYGPMISRCNSCHNNGIEALALFSVSVLAAVVAGVDKAEIASASSFFVASRLLYTALYITGNNQAQGAVRTLVWTVTPYTFVSLLMSAAKASA